jgi:hypothetical protein
MNFVSFFVNLTLISTPIGTGCITCQPRIGQLRMEGKYVLADEWQMVLPIEATRCMTRQ